jgi:hypothetical protein
MLVPVYVDLDGKNVIRIGSMRITGSNTQELQVKLPQRPKRVLINYHYDVLATESISAGK